VNNFSTTTMKDSATRPWVRFLSSDAYFLLDSHTSASPSFTTKDLVRAQLVNRHLLGGLEPV
jgi:hypothetical protein